MAEPSSANEAQTAFMCQFCDQQNVKWKCEDCGVYLCNSCKEKVHPRLKSSDKHKVISLKDIGKSKYYDNEPWYHGKMSREKAENLLQKHKYMGNWIFLVRESDVNSNHFVLDFLLDGEPKHIKIKKMDDLGKLKCDSKGGEIMFDNLYEVVRWVNTKRHIENIPIKLTKPVPKEIR